MMSVVRNLFCVATIIASRCLSTVVNALAVSQKPTTAAFLRQSLQGKTILVVGGSGRVGGSCVTQLLQQGAAHVQVGGIRSDHFDQAKARWQQLFPELESKLANGVVSFVQLDRHDATSVQHAMTTASTERFDLVIHSAGPFQGKVTAVNGVLQACVALGVPYLDVCDDYCTAMAAKTQYASAAIASQTPCIISTGCWPGVSSLMAWQLVSRILRQRPELSPTDLRVDFSFFTAGSGGAGVTLLVATFLILAEPALVVQRGRRRQVPSMQSQDSRRVWFGKHVGDKTVAPLNLLETASIADVLGVGSVTSRFGTAPDFWNALLGFMAQLPSSLLSNEELMRRLSVFSLPIVRLVDTFAGATNAMHCRVTTIDKEEDGDDDLFATAVYAHENLEPCVGQCVAAFAAAILTPGLVSPGVWFPEEALTANNSMDEEEQMKLTAALLACASIGAHTTLVESSPSLNLSTDEIWGSS